MWGLVRSACWYVRDLIRSRAHLAAENQFLRQQVVVLRRQVGRARPTDPERGLLAFFARLFPWRDREALQLVTPETLIRWHRLTGPGRVGGTSVGEVGDQGSPRRCAS